MSKVVRQPPERKWEDLTHLEQASHHDPFCILGKHQQGELDTIRVFIPGAVSAALVQPAAPMQRYAKSALFTWKGPKGKAPNIYKVQWQDEQGDTHEYIDPYCFAPQLKDFDLHLFNEGKHWHAYRFLGAHPIEVDGIAGTLFATWAPNAQRVSVVGDFNQWDGRRHPMRIRGFTGVWELFIPGLAAQTLYKFEIRNRDRGTVHIKSDPYGQTFELRPNTANRVVPTSEYVWSDTPWLEQRMHKDWTHEPLSIYEVHLGSWQRDEQGNFLNYRALAERLVDYVKQCGFNYIELLPITEHPLDASWGYQTNGYYAPTSRFGDPDDLRYFIDQCHQAQIGVLLDWVPGHFPKDQHGLAYYDGSALYEHEDPRKGEHRDWGTLIFNYGRNEVKNFLLSSALYWLEEFHIDGLRVDAVASMLYLDYSRAAGDWIPNIHGGRENLEAIEFLRALNCATHDQHPGTLIIAEESTAWPQVSRPTYLGGLGFSMKWNMGWMHDSLTYLSKDPIHRHYHHQELTFGILYAFTENFVLPFSHDEVVHGKGSMLNKMPGDEAQKFANLRLLYAYMFSYPGKKLLFMGNEFGQGIEWNVDKSLEWYVLQYPLHQGLLQAVKDLNRLYQTLPELHYFDFSPEGFEWIDCHDAAQSTLSYLRKYEQHLLVVILNFTPVVRHAFRIGVPQPGQYKIVFNSDSNYYEGNNYDTGTNRDAQPTSCMGHPYSIVIDLPPLSALFLRLERN